MYKFLWGCMFSFSFGKILRIELLGWMVTPCLTFWWTTKLFYEVSVPLYFPERKKFKRLMTLGVDKDLEELERSCLASESIKQYNYFGNEPSSFS